MEYEVFDSSGTDDDLPPSLQNRVSRVARAAASGRSAVGSAPYFRMHSDMEAQIHQLEQEAYCSVLRAFKAQSDAITWEKEGLITELRKELRVSDDEHRELLTRVNADDIIRTIRDWRQAGGHQAARLNAAQPVHDILPSPNISAFRKKPRITPIVRFLSFGVSSLAISVALDMQPSSAASQGSALESRGKKSNPLIVSLFSFPQQGQALPGLTPMKSLQYPFTGPSGNRQYLDRSSSGTFPSIEPAEADPLIGNKVWTRWPADNNFYEAVITDYDPAEGLHALVYDQNTPNQTWEWVNLKEIPAEDIRWECEDTGIAYRGGHSGQDRGLRKPLIRGGPIPGGGRGRGSGKVQFRRESLPSQNGIGKKLPDDIELLNTETLVKEVERVFDASHLDPLELEKAKKMLKEHEQALIDAIARLADASDGETEEQRFSHGEQPFSHGLSMDQG
ncbi:LOW QUALITY PROTEIN: ENT domain-containing protein [Cephalotus follicularis]|uniref:ENT domain-containing protein n=1 Tax=Cephalotus follicularis TaxID=3775 RepID=A0A1Q3B7S4_CEPFO|nr:LOW QUALITY PROTEIN: ENT domain-containing protein [Cephalotus follicularis]